MLTAMKWASLLWLSSLSLLAAAQGVNCPSPDDVKPAQLHGAWQVQFRQPPPGWPTQAKVRLQAHLEFKDSLSGSIERAPAPGHPTLALLAGDLDDGVLVLDESSDGLRITAVWEGSIVLGSCGREIQGYWKDTRRDPNPLKPAPETPFLLKR